MKTLQTITKSGFRVTIDGRQIYFTSATGLEITRDVAKVPNGRTRTMEPVMGMKQYGAVTVMKPYEPASADDQFLLGLMEAAPEDAQGRRTITIQAVKGDDGETPFGAPVVLLGCLVSSVKVGDADRSSGGDGSMLELIFEPTGHKLG
jgi:hypothetical protein